MECGCSYCLQRRRLSVALRGSLCGKWLDQMQAADDADRTPTRCMAVGPVTRCRVDTAILPGLSGLRIAAGTSAAHCRGDAGVRSVGYSCRSEERRVGKEGRSR